MTDKREDIMVRLLAIAGGIWGINTALRNTQNISDSKYPAILILDADESVQDLNDNKGRPATTYMVVSMTPEIYILTTGEAGAVGTSVNALRAKLIKAVLSDATLATIVGTNGSVRYEGCATDLAMGRSMQGHMGVSFAFTYVLRPADL